MEIELIKKEKKIQSKSYTISRGEEEITVGRKRGKLYQQVYYKTKRVGGVEVKKEEYLSKYIFVREVIKELKVEELDKRSECLIQVIIEGVI